jgi:hypothetical protein
MSDSFWDTWNEDLFEAKTAEDDRRLEQRLADHDEAELDAMLDKLDEGAGMVDGSGVAARRRRQRKTSIRKIIADAERTGKNVTSVTTPDGTTLRFGEPGAVTSANPWDEVLQ